MQKLALPTGIIASLLSALVMILAMAGCDNNDPSPKTFTVTFNLNAEDAQGQVDPQTVETGKTATQPSVEPTRDRYNFEGWFVDKNDATANYDFTRPVTRDITLYAQWEKVAPGPFTVSFIAKEGFPALSKVTVKGGSLVDKPDTNPTRDGYLLEGWFTDNETFQNEFDFNTPIATDITLYAKWIKEHKVTFKLNRSKGGTISQAVQDNNNAIQPQAPTREGYNFDGWFVDNDTFQSKFDFDTPITSDITLYAKWIEKYKIAFDLNGGQGDIASQIVQNNDIATKPDPDPIRDGYTFGGWFTDNGSFQNEFDFHTPVKGSAILYARWYSETSIKVLADMLSNTDALLSKTLLRIYHPDATVVRRYLKPGGSSDGSSWSNAAGNLKTFLDNISVNKISNHDSVYVLLLATGEYEAGEKMSMKNHVAILGGFAGQNDGDLSLSLTDTTRLSGEDRYQVFANQSLDHTALLYGLRVEKGKAYDGGGMSNASSSPTLIRVAFTANSATNNGGGMHNESSSPALTDVTFAYNSAGTSGGGMGNINSSSPTLTRVSFSGNSAAFGGGMSNFTSSPILTDVAFSTNLASSSGGGMNNLGSSPTLTRVTFSDNSAAFGGGIDNRVAGNLPVFLTDVTFAGNSAIKNGGGINSESSSLILIRVAFSDNSAASGGGMYNANSSSITLTDVAFSGNSAADNGGGMNNTNSSPTLARMAFVNNAARNGGGMYNDNSSPALVHTTFSDNSAIYNGGGMSNFYSSPTLVHTIFSGNTATNKGGGVYNDNNGRAGPIIANSIFWNNKAVSAGKQLYMNNDTGMGDENLALYYTVLENGINAIDKNFNESGAVKIEEAGISDQDPMLGALGDYGGFVQTIPIGASGSANDLGLYVRRSGNTLYYSADKSTWFKDPESPASTTSLPGNSVDLTAHDARRYARQGRPDAGAYEQGATTK